MAEAKVSDLDSKSAQETPAGLEDSGLLVRSKSVGHKLLQHINYLKSIRAKFTADKQSIDDQLSEIEFELQHYIRRYSEWKYETGLELREQLQVLDEKLQSGGITFNESRADRQEAHANMFSHDLVRRRSRDLRKQQKYVRREDRNLKLQQTHVSELVSALNKFDIRQDNRSDTSSSPSDIPSLTASSPPALATAVTASAPALYTAGAAAPSVFLS